MRISEAAPYAYTGRLEASPWMRLEATTLACESRSEDETTTVEGRFELCLFADGKTAEVGLLRVDGELRLAFHYPTLADDGQLVADRVVDFAARPKARRAIKGPIAVFDGPTLRFQVDLGPDAWAFVPRGEITSEDGEWSLHSNELVVVDGDHALAITPEPVDVVRSAESADVGEDPAMLARIRAGAWTHVFATV